MLRNHQRWETFVEDDKGVQGTAREHMAYGIDAPEHHDFVVGNVLEKSLPTMLRHAHQVGYIRELLHGLDNCQAGCAFFDFCRGAHAGNRYFEHGTFAATETAHCRNTRQALVKAFATGIKE